MEGRGGRVRWERREGKMEGLEVGVGGVEERSGREGWEGGVGGRGGRRGLR